MCIRDSHYLIGHTQQRRFPVARQWAIRHVVKTVYEGLVEEPAHPGSEQVAGERQSRRPVRRIGWMLNVESPVSEGQPLVLVGILMVRLRATQRVPQQQGPI